MKRLDFELVSKMSAKMKMPSAVSPAKGIFSFNFW